MWLNSQLLALLQPTVRYSSFRIACGERYNASMEDLVKAWQDPQLSNDACLDLLYVVLCIDW